MSPPNPTSRLRQIKNKPRVFIVSDISNEPDDAESLCRYLLYSNEFDTRGLVACTSTWMKRTVHPEDMEKIVRAYGKVVENLNEHVHPGNRYSTGEEILGLIRTGPSLYGKEALEPDVPLSSGAQLLIDRVDESSEELWILCWGGTNVLAQALKHVSTTRSAEDFSVFRSKFRVYAISDQDDTGNWMRQQWPDLFYIASVHGWNQYGLAAWTGISGEGYYGFNQGGPDYSQWTKEWLKEHIQIGPLGSAYPDYFFIPEGDTPTFLYLIQNGLGSPNNPEWGSWGGRYLRTMDTLYTGKAVSKSSNHYSDAVDRVVGKDGNIHVGSQATIWRWRAAYQNDFAARMQWTLGKDYTKANHAPVVIVNDSGPGPEPFHVSAEAGSAITLDASQSYDPDEGDEISFHWSHYKDITASQWNVDAEVADVTFTPVSSKKATMKVQLPPPDKCAVDLFTRQPQKLGQIMHLILEVRDNGTPQLRTYKRVVVQITNEELKGGGKVFESVGEMHEAMMKEEEKQE